MVDLFKVIDESVASNDAELLDINRKVRRQDPLCPGPLADHLMLQIHSTPELKFEETFAHETLTRCFESHGFEVERGAYGLPTAFRASYGPSTARAIAINLECVLFEYVKL